MSVRRRLILLLCAIIAIFAVALFVIWQIDRQQFAALEGARLTQRKEALDRFLQQWGTSLRAFVNQQSRSDGLLEAIKNSDRAWVEANLSSSVLTDYGAHTLWIYRADGSLFFGRNSLYVDKLDEAPVPRDGFEKLFSNQKAVHFFAKAPAGVVEIRGATVHPSRDAERTSPAGGYLFVGRLWSPEELKEMSTFHGDALSLVDTSYATDGLVLPNGTIAFTQNLPGWDGKAAGRLLVQSESPWMTHISVLRWQTWAWVIAFTVVLIGAVLFALRKWVWRPMRRLGQSLRGEDVTLIRAYDNDRGEVGAIARMIRSFFEQREAILREMNARRQAEKALHDTEEQLRHSQKIEAVGRLAGGVAYDFNNFLTAIIGYGLLLQERLARDTEARTQLEEMLKAAYRAATLTRQLLAFSRKQILYPRTIDLNKLVQDLEPMLRRLVKYQVELRVLADAPQSSVRVDRTQMEQVLLSLVDNARDAMPNGGILTVSTADTLIPEPTEQNGIELPAGTYVTLEVSDTGTGMDEATRERIFEPFFTTKPAGDAIGLSLAAVYGTVQQSGGAITVKSTPGEGSTFLIHLPLVAEPATDLASSPYQPNAYIRPQGETVLIVESDPGVLRLVSSVLTQQGFRVLTAEDAASARTLEEQNPGTIRLLLTNAVVRGGSGAELAEEFRRRQTQMEVLYMNGYPEFHGQENTVSGDEEHLLVKPFTPAVLIERVCQILSSRSIGGSRAERRPRALDVTVEAAGR